MQFTREEIQLYRHFCRSPIFFIEKLWGLTPQPLKPEYVDVAASTPLKSYKAKWFKPFVKGKHITWQQWVALLAVEKALKGEAPNKISIKSGHGVGKDAVLSWLIYWYLFTHKEAQVPCTAPTSEQMHDILWKELEKWRKRMLISEIADFFIWQNGYLRCADSPYTWFARARTAKKENPEALAGVHADYVFLAVDEASGVADVVFQSAEGSLTNDNVLVFMISNPTRLVGYFYDSHHEDKASWQTLAFNSEESPIVSEKYIERIGDKYGYESDEYRVRVKGRFPKENSVDDDGYMPLLSGKDIQFCEDEEFTGDKRMGIDSAGSGRNKSAWMGRDAFKAKVLLTEKNSTPNSVAKKTMTLITEHGFDPDNVWNDNFGEGANTAYNILKANRNMRINSVSFKDDAEDERFFNKRAEMYWAIRKWLKGGGKIVRYPKLKRQLRTIKYCESLSGKIQIMSKKKMLKLGIPSPDEADALALTFYRTEAMEVEQARRPNYAQPKRGKRYGYRLRG